jgi:dipeptidyl aminopeptidase/acylaminoacyl peptidase
MTAERLWALPRVGTPSPAPDGSFVVVPVTTHREEPAEPITRLYLVPTADGSAAAAPTPLTAPEWSAEQPVVSPDGARVAFVRKPAAGTARHDSVSQLYMMELGGGEPQRMTDLPLGVEDPRWFPDSRRIAFLGLVFADAPDLEQTAELASQDEGRPDLPIVTEDRVYRYWDRWLTDGKVHHIFVVDSGGGQLRDLTPSGRGWFSLADPKGQYAISPDGREIAFSATRSRPPHDPLQYGVFTVQVGTEANVAPDIITGHTTGDAVQPAYSPDGRHLLYGFQREPDFYADRVRLALYDRRTQTHTVLTESWDRSAGTWCFLDAGTIGVEAEDQGRSALFVMELDVDRGKPAGQPRVLVRGGRFSRPLATAGRIWTTLSTYADPPEVVSCSFPDGLLSRHTDFATAQTRGLRLADVAELTIEGADGEPVQVYVLRSGLAGEGPRPLIHLVHGGPHGIFGDEWHWRWNAQVFAASGAVVALVNFHGSTSWGEAFTRSMRGAWGEKPYRDVMAATDFLVEKGWVDERRMAVAGGSYGGYLVSWIASQTDRFACIVNHAGVCDLRTQFAADMTQGRAAALGGAPWRDSEAMERYNPLSHAEGFQSPMLVIHGERDYRVPHAQGLEIYNVYKARGLPARLVLYRDENHWVLSRRNSLHWHREVLGWLQRWLGIEVPMEKRDRPRRE